MKNRTSSHFFILALIVVMTAISHYSIYYGALIRGYETSVLTAYRNILLLCLLAVLPIFLKHVFKFKGNWTVYTSCVLLFSIGLTIQYRLFSDREYAADIPTSERLRIQNSGETDKEKASDLLHAKLTAIAKERQAKIKTLQMHFVQETYSAEKKQVMGLPPTPPSPVDLSAETPRPSTDTLREVIFRATP